jgi:hypothetical protein
LEQAGTEHAGGGHDHAGTAEPPAEEVPRSLQSTAGLLTEPWSRA